jgi:peptide/nickel transport system permease protein
VERQMIEDNFELEFEADPNDAIYNASHWKLMWMRFRKHKLAMIGVVIVIFMYTLALFAEFIAPNDPNFTSSQYSYRPPQRIRIIDSEKNWHWPFVSGLKQARDPVTLRLNYVEDTSVRVPISLFVRGSEYTAWGRVEGNLHLFGTKDGPWFPLGTDRLGRCILSRIIYGARISTTIGLVGVLLSFVFGLILGGSSGFYGGAVDIVVQRITEFLSSMPQIPLWMALSAALPANLPPLQMYFGITIILSLFAWTGLARVVRGKFLSLRQEDFVMAATLSGTSNAKIIRRHLIPTFTSHIIAQITLSIPAMIIGETSLSFIGVGLRPPTISWGVLLREAQNLRTISQAPWLLIPGLFIIATVLAFNFMGDGLRDAADPYSQ